MHEVNTIIQSFGLVLKYLLLDEKTAEGVDAFAFNLMREAPSRARMFAETGADTVIVKVGELSLDVQVFEQPWRFVLYQV